MRGLLASLLLVIFAGIGWGYICNNFPYPANYISAALGGMCIAIGGAELFRRIK